MLDESLIFSAILDEINKKPAPCEITQKRIQELYLILEKNQYRVNRSRSVQQINHIIDLIIKGV